MVADRALAIFIERLREPKRPAVGERTKAGIDVVETRIDQLDRNDEAPQEIGDGTMRIDVGAKFVAAEEHVAAEEGVAFPFEIEILRQPDDFVAVFFHPARKVRRFSGAFFVAEITWNETTADGEAGV